MVMVRKVKKNSKTASKASMVKANSRPLGRFKTFWCGLRPERKISVCVGFVVLIFGLVYGGLVVYQKSVLEINRKDLAKLQQQIISELGTPDAQSLKSRCGYAGVALGRGERSCSVSLYLRYDSKDLSLSRIITGLLPKITNSQLTKYTDKDLLESWKDQNLATSFKSGDTKCYASLIVSGDKTNIVKPIPDHELSNKIDLTCTIHKALREYYLVDMDSGFKEY